MADTPCPHPEFCGVKSHRTPKGLEECARNGRALSRGRRGVRGGAGGVPTPKPESSVARNLLAGARMGHGSTHGLDEYLLNEVLHDSPSEIEAIDNGISGYPDAAIRMTIGTGEAVLGIRKDGEFRDFATFAAVNGEPVGKPVETWRPVNGGYGLGLRLSGDIFGRLAYAAHPGRAEFDSTEVTAAPATLSDDARHLVGLLIADSDQDPLTDLAESDRSGRRNRAARLLLGDDLYEEFYDYGAQDRETPDNSGRFRDDPVAERAAWIPWARGFEYGS